LARQDGQAEKAIIGKTMPLFNNNPVPPADPPPPAEQQSAPELPASLAGDPITYVAMHPDAAHPLEPNLPEDLRISWSWRHFLVFLVFGVISQIALGVVVVGYYSSERHLSQRQIFQLLNSEPQIQVLLNVVWFAVVLLFLYMTLGVLRDMPFWRTLGWKKLNAGPSLSKTSPWVFFFAGSGLALFVAFSSTQIHTSNKVPIEDLFKTQESALLLMAMAVLVAPLVEETVFRGYLYPLIARSFGILPGILVTGILFGLMHGAQLGWTPGFVILLSIVGLVFTFARARTGTVLASYLLHLGYNSMIAVSTLIDTRGFTHFPPHH
jgi:membrane protease YdiL (CAAX protease family)